MKASELRQKTEAELRQSEIDLVKEQFNLMMQKGTGQLSKPSELKKLRKDIARINTVLSEKRARV